MKILGYFICAVFAGMIYHQAERHTAKLSVGWGSLTNYAIGVIGTLPFFAWCMKVLGMSEDEIIKAVSAFLTAFLAVGIGVSGARWMDALWPKPDTEEKP
jgi:uncharacterized membrane protein YeaQ/YmgE (transglycosylase-associated protein family)